MPIFREQLQEYLNLRESQKHLRELSVQRQILLMNSDRQKSTTPIGIGTFLQPIHNEYSPKKSPPKITLDEGAERRSIVSLGMFYTCEKIRFPTTKLLAFCRKRS